MGLKCVLGHDTVSGKDQFDTNTFVKSEEIFYCKRCEEPVVELGRADWQVEQDVNEARNIIQEKEKYNKTTIKAAEKILEQA